MEPTARKFVIQEHTRSGQTHWDLMLEFGRILKAWRLDKSPELIGSKPISAAKSFDHDLKFLTYEGPVNKGLGSVRIADKGIFELIAETETQIRVKVQGKILSGEFELKHIENDQWRFSVFARHSQP